MYVCVYRICVQKYNYCMCAHEHAVSHLCHVPPIAVRVDRPPFGSHSYSLLCNTSTVLDANNDDNTSQFTPKFVVSLDHMNTQRNCRHDETKTQRKVNGYFFVSASVILRFFWEFSLHSCTLNESACRDCLKHQPTDRMIPAFWGMMPCILVSRYHYFGGAYNLNHTDFFYVFLGFTLRISTFIPHST